MSYEVHVFVWGRSEHAMKTEVTMPLSRMVRRVSNRFSADSAALLLLSVGFSSQRRQPQKNPQAAATAVCAPSDDGGATGDGGVAAPERLESHWRPGRCQRRAESPECGT